MESKSMPLVKISPKNQVVIPKEVREKHGMGPGDYVEVISHRGQVVIKRKKIIDDFPITDEPIGPKTRAGIRQGLKEIKDGKATGPFKKAKDLIHHLHQEAGITSKKS